MNRRNLIKALALAPFVPAGVVKALHAESVTPPLVLKAAEVKATGRTGVTLSFTSWRPHSVGRYPDTFGIVDVEDENAPIIWKPIWWSKD